MDNEAIQARFKTLAIGNRNKFQERREPEIPIGLPIAGKKDRLQQVIDEFLSQEFVMTNERFLEDLDIPDITEHMYKGTDDFLDDYKLNSPAILLDLRTDRYLAELGRIVIPMMVSGFSPAGVGAIFFLAFNIKDDLDGAPVFTTRDIIVNSKDTEFGHLSDTPPPSSSHHRVHKTLPATTDVKGEARAYCYLAASLLRLFRDSEEKYVGLFNQIVAGYSRFYRRPMSISPPRPTIEGIRTLSHHFSHGDLFKSTLFRILYCGGGSTRSEGMRRFLYETHLANTGMHVSDIFFKLCAKLNCKPSVLLEAVWSDEYKRQLTALGTMVKLATKNDQKHARQMWRYARIFDERFMPALQTKACPGLTFILAAALKSVAPQENQNIFKIAQFADINPEKRRIYALIGEEVIKLVRSGTLT